MDLSPFKVKRKKHCSSCYKVKLYDNDTKKDENLVVGESLLGRYHRHVYGQGSSRRAAAPVVLDSGCWEDSLVALDSTTLCCCCCSSRSGGSALLRLFRLVKDYGVETEDFECPDDYRRRGARMLAVDRKLYVLGGLPPPPSDDDDDECDDDDESDEEFKVAVYDNKIKVGAEYIWSQVFDPATAQWEIFTASSPFYNYAKRSAYEEFYAATLQSRIVIISPRQASVFVHNPHAPTGWERMLYHHKLSFIRWQPMIAGSTIYWINEWICALDVETGVYFHGYVPGHQISNIINEAFEDQTTGEYLRLIHIGGDAEDAFCLVWLLGDECHFTRLQISKDYDSVDGRRVGDLRISIISCSSKIIPKMEYLTSALLMDIVGDGMEDVMVESACEEMPNKDALGSASVLKRCKNRSVDSEKALSQKEGTPDSEFVRSKNVKLESACKEMSNKDASGSASVKRCKKRSIDSEKALSQKEDALGCEVVIFKKPRVYSEKSLPSKEDDASDREVIGSPVVLTRYEKSKGKKKKMQEQ